MNTLLFVSKLVFNLMGLGAAAYVFYFAGYRRVGFYKPIYYTTLLGWSGVFIAYTGFDLLPTWLWDVVNTLCLFALAGAVRYRLTREKSPLNKKEPTA